MRDHRERQNLPKQIAKISLRLIDNYLGDLFSHPRLNKNYSFYFTTDIEVETEEKMSDEMVMQKEMKIEEQLMAMKSLMDKHACLENEISEMIIVMESTREGLQIE